MTGSEQENRVYFDDSCKLCNRLVGTLQKDDMKKELRFFTVQNTPYQEWNTIVFQKKGKIYTKSKAIREILRVIKKKRWLQLLLVVLPTFIIDAIYDFIARHRHRLIQTN